MKSIIAALTLLGLANTASADEPQALDQLLANFGWNLDATEIRTEKVADGLYVLFGVGGNIGVSIGEQGVLVVDDMFPELYPKIRAAIAAIDGGDGSVDFVVNTHWHFDHAEGNLAFGPAGAWIVAQANSQERMGQDHLINLVKAKYAQPAYPPAARPAISYDTSMHFHLNGTDIDLLHVGPAHTTGDTAVIFRKHNAVHMGDVYNGSGYPFIDAGNGGDIDGMISFCKSVLAEVGPDGIVIPGHGPIADGRALAAYIEMLETVRGRVAALIAEGKTLEEVEASKPTGDLDEKFGDESASLGFVNRVYTSLKNSDAK